MAKGQSPLLGYNTNVRHKGRVFHIQTEDSGIQHPHVITHLFADGGRILKSIKTPYGELLEAQDWTAQVKKIMQDQHKAMFIALRDGQYDHLIDPNSPLAPPSGQTGSHAALNSAGQVAAPANPGAPRSVPDAATGPTPSTVTTGPKTGNHPLPATNSQPAIAARPVTKPSSPGQPAAPMRPSTPGVRAPNASPSTPGIAPSTGQHAAATANRSGRYAPIRSPDILGSFKQKQPETASIFGDGLMSEKSLDEVILAYLADDLDDAKKP